MIKPFRMEFPFSSAPEVLFSKNIKYVEGVYEGLCKQLSEGVNVHVINDDINPIGKSVGFHDGRILIDILEPKFQHIFGLVNIEMYCIGTVMEAEADLVDGVQVIQSAKIQRLVIMPKSHALSEVTSKDSGYDVISKERTLDLGG